MANVWSFVGILMAYTLFVFLFIFLKTRLAKNTIDFGWVFIWVFVGFIFGIGLLVYAISTI